MRIRKSSRLLVINENHQILLFQFTHTNDALAGQSHWATIGGGLEEGEPSNKQLAESFMKS